MSVSARPSSPLEPRVFRTDIQALRGIAILFVLLFHALPETFPAGYLGVDIFFVVSGYLITDLLRKNIQDGTFTFRAFYFRRAKRLLPAAYVMFAGAALASLLLLSMQQRRDFAKQLLGGITFSANFVLWKEIDYFSPSAHLLPLLHIWSLAIEEQFYLLLPATMYFLPRRLWFRVIGSCGVISVALFYVLSPRQPVTSFYLLHTRAWELAMGSVGALGGFTFARTSRIPFRAALAILVMIPVLPLTVLSPRWHALLICSATLVVLLANDAAVATSRAARLLAAVGDCSYSVYLVHWPLLAFANNCWVRPVPTAVRIALLVTALPLGYGLYRFVERPLWRAPLQFSARSARVIAAASLILAMAAGLVGWVHRPSADYTAVRRANYGLSEACAFVSTFRPLPECRTSPSPRMGVWGDSFAMHLVPGIVATTDVGVVQATRSSCGPFVDVAPFDDTDITIGWAKECIAFNDSVIEYLEGASSIQTVVLASPFRHYVDGAAAPQPYRLLHRRGGSYTVGDGGVTEALRAMKATVARIRALGKRVVVVAPPPADGETNIAECLERRALGLPVFGTAHSDCSLSVLSYRRHASRVLDFLARLPEESGVGVFSFDSFLCSAESCATTRDGKFLYRDGTHLSYEGSVLLATRLRLSERLIALAR